MQVIKKGVKLTISVIGIILFCACTKRVPVSVIPESSPTPSQEIEVTVVPTITETIFPTKGEISPTKEPTPTITEIPTATKEPTATKRPTATKEPTATKRPTPTITKTPTVTKEPTATKKPTPTITKTPTATKEPTPMVENKNEQITSATMDSLIKNGWQSMVDISQSYYVLFSECFNNSEVIKGDNTLDIRYTSEQEKNIQFQVLYSIEQTLHQALNKVVEQSGVILEENTLDGTISYIIEKGNMVYRGTILEKEYKRELLGDVFGEEERIVGTMQIVFSYPKVQYAKYESDDFKYYLVKIP